MGTPIQKASQQAIQTQPIGCGEKKLPGASKSDQPASKAFGFLVPKQPGKRTMKTECINIVGISQSPVHVKKNGTNSRQIQWGNKYRGRHVQAVLALFFIGRNISYSSSSGNGSIKRAFSFSSVGIAAFSLGALSAGRDRVFLLEEASCSGRSWG